jgi:hypothetical protein
MKRVQQNNIDTNDAQSQGYNEAAGGFKQVTIGPKLKSLGAAGSAVYVGAGKQVAIFTASSATCTIGDASVTSLALGSGGIPLIANAWNYLAMGIDTHIICSAATVYVFEIIDDTIMR